MTYVEDLRDVDLLRSIWVALRRIESALAAGLSLPELPIPLVTVSPPEIDLAEIVTAVSGLKPGPTAEEIALAIASVLSPPLLGAASEDGAEALAAVARALEKLDFRLKGMGTQAYGGGSVSLMPNQTVGVTFPAGETGLAKDATLLRRYGDHVTKAGFENLAGDRTLHTPASGKRIRLYWIALSSSQDNVAENLIQVKLTDADGDVKYRWRMGNPGAFVGSRTIEGNVDATLILNLANTNGVDWNVDLEEVT